MNRLDSDPIACTIATLALFAGAIALLSLPPHNVSQPAPPSFADTVKDTLSPADCPAPVAPVYRQRMYADGLDTGP